MVWRPRATALCFAVRKRFAPLLGSFATSLALAWGPSAIAANFTVTNPGDDGTNGTLRWAIEQANAAGTGTHTISFSVPANSILQLVDDLPELNNPGATIEMDGIGAGGVTISGHNNHRVLFVAAGNWHVRNVNIHNGSAQGGDGGNGYGGGGGGLGAGGAVFVNSGASLTVRNVNFENNNAIGGDGGARTQDVSHGGGGGGGLGGDGGNAPGAGGGGGGGARGNGGEGGSGGGGGGGGLFLPGLPGVGPFGGPGAPLGGWGGDSNQSGEPGLTAGGGGGGGQTADGGDAGNFAGGGGGGGLGGNGAWGGFGGGGGGSGWLGDSDGGQGGFGAGDGGYDSDGEGGSGYGGAVFVREGGTFIIENSNTSGNSVQEGTGEAWGNAAGSDLYLMDGVTATFRNQGISNTNNYSGSIAGDGGIAVTNGHTTLTGENTYSGGTQILGTAVLEGTTTSLQGAIENHGTVEINQNIAGNLTAAISGSGQLIKYGTGNVTLNYQTNYTGGTVINGGALTVTTDILQGEVTNMDTLIFDQDDSGEFLDEINGTGQLIKNGSGFLTLSNVNNQQSSFLINDGGINGTTATLNATTITNNSVLHYDQTFDGTIGATINGTGNLFKTDSGTVTIAGTVQQGRTDIINGGLIVNGTLSSDTWVGSDGLLGGAGTIIGDVHNFGNMSAGNSIDTITVIGDYTQEAGSTMTVEINDGGDVPGVNSDLVDVTGTAFLEGGTVNVVADPGTYTAGMTYGFLQASAIVGSFEGATVSGIGPGMHASIGYGIFNGQDWAYLMLFDNQTDFVSVAETYNEYQIATYLDDESASATGQFQQLLDEMVLLPPDGQRMAMNQLTGVVNPSIAQLSVQDTTFLYMMLRRRVGSAFAAGGLIGGDESDWASIDAEESDSLILPCSYGGSSSSLRSVSSSGCRPCWSGWMSGYGFGGSAESDGNAAGGTFGSGGSIVAMERALDSTALVGFFGAYSYLGMQLSQVPQSANANQGLLGTYFLKNFNRGYVLAAGSVGFAGYNETRNLTIGGFDATARGTYDGWNPTTYLEYGRRYQYGRTSIQPYLAGQYVYVRQNGFTETGAGTANLQIDGADTHALRGLLGARAAQTWRDGYGRVWIPELRAVWMHEFLDPDTTITAIFAPVGGSSFATRGLNFGRDWAILGGGTQYVLNHNVSVFANYDLLVNGNEVWNAGSGGVQVAW